MQVKKEDIQALLDRRKELLEQINKLNKEYTAIGNIVTEILKQKELEDDRR